MAQIGRPEISRSFVHLTTHGVRWDPIFLDGDDYSSFLVIAGRNVRRFGWTCVSYCVMPNHYHLLVWVEEPNLAQGMQRLNLSYALTFNRRYRFRGHVFDAPYEPTIVQSEAHLLWLARYIARNPVEAGLCERLEDWPWSSWGAAAQGTLPDWVEPDAMSRYFGDGDAGLERLRVFIQAA